MNSNLLRLRPTEGRRNASGADWIREARRGVQELLADVNVHTPDVTASDEEVLSSSRSRLVQFWKKEGEAFTTYWHNLTQMERIGILQTVAPFMPCRRGDRVVKCDGDPIDVYGIAQLCVELNVAGLSSRKEGEGLVSIMVQCVKQAWTSIRSADRPLLTDMDEADIKVVKRLIHLEIWPQNNPRTYIYVTGDRKGHHVTVTPSHAATFTGVHGTNMIHVDVYNGVRLRQTTLVHTLLLVTDVYFEDNDDRTRAINVIKSVGCPSCGKVDIGRGSERVKFHVCPCRLAAYCSATCQARHWNKHKAVCNRGKGNKQGAATGSAAATGAESASDSNRSLSAGCTQWMSCCWNCGAEDAISGGPMNKCAGCLIAMYCGTQCQKQHWHEHKPDCKKAGSKEQEQAAGGST